SLAYGTVGTMSRTNMGSLPTAGQWVQLQVPAGAVGLEGRIVEGMAFTLYSGRAAWDSAGLVVPDLDGDGVADIDADGLADPWELEHFGDLTQPGDGDYDNDGVSNLDEYNAGSDPNTIQFSTVYDNLYVSNRTVNGACEMLGGVPSSIAVLINDTNLAGATWQAYTSNFSAMLPDADGGHTVLVALWGLTSNFPPAWDETEFTLDRMPPVLQITNPVSASATVTKPYLQLRGLANEPLASLAYDLTNAAGLLTNESAFVVDQYFDTNQFDFTTNYFQAYDVELTNGLNTITLTVCDLAGNVAVTNLNVTLDYTTATNPPVMGLIWPTNGAHLSGDAFYVRGWINDETARVKAQIVDGGVTNEFAGLVERNGTFWVEDLPLASGTNLVTLVAEDTAGNLSSTNLSVVKSTVTLTITSTPEGESLYEPFGTVAGTVSDAAYAVWVNGVAATVDEYGYWQAENVPVFGRGTAVFDVVAKAGGSPALSVSAQEEKPAQIVVVKHESNKTVITDGPGSSHHQFTHTKGYTTSLEPGPGASWIHHYLGKATDRNEYSGPYGSGWDQAVYQWSATNRSTHATDSTPSEWSSTNILNDTHGDITGVPDKNVRELGEVGGPEPLFVHHYYARGVRHEWENLDGSTTMATVEAPLTQMKLYTGGKAGIKRSSLIQINASAERYDRPPSGPWLHTPATPITPAKIQVLGKQLGNDGRLWLALPDNEDKYLNLQVPGVKHYGAWATPAKHKLRILASNTPLDPDKSNVEFCVGQKVTFTHEWNVDFPYAGEPATVSSCGWDWVMSAKFVNRFWQRSYQDPLGGEVFYGSVNYDLDQNVLKTASPHAWWVSGGGKNVALNLTMHFDNGHSVRLRERGKFAIYRPDFLGITNLQPAHVVIRSNTTTLSVGQGTGNPNDGSVQFDIQVSSTKRGWVEVQQLIKAWRRW
ncbi:MAG: hypothetical protein KJ070_26325, partial [Verrucomicrobia bacterium]|nr:hypothetical protein [Verrucomicrobiota bacterium]